MFGHVIQLNFNGNSSAQKTLLGGIVSIFIKVTMIIYVFLNLKKMMLYEDNKLVTQLKYTNLEELGQVPFRKMNINPFFVLRKQLLNDAPLFLNETLSRYLDIKFSQVDTDWHKPNDDGRFTYKEFKAKQCTVEDFTNGDETNDEAMRLYNSWEGFSLVCPDISEEQDFMLQNGPGDMVNRNMLLVIK